MRANLKCIQNERYLIKKEKRRENLKKETVRPLMAATAIEKH